MLKINGVSVKEPSVFTVEILDIDGETNRNAKGEIIRDRIAVKRKLSLEWNALTQAEISTILNAISNVFFTVTYLDAKDGVVTKTFYVGDRSAPLYTLNAAGQVIWKGLKCNFIEK